MRHIVYILIIILIISISIGYRLFAVAPPEKEPALSINNKVFSTEELDQLSRMRGKHQTRKEFINSIVTEELLIQEAQRLEIHKQEDFRQSVENFYKQSLIKILIDRKLDSLNIIVDNEEVNRYADLQNSIIHITKYHFKTLEEVSQPLPPDGDKKSLSFKNLSGRMAYLISSIEEGQATKPIKDSEEYIVYRLDRIEKGETIDNVPKSLIKKIIGEEKKQEAIDEWIVDLKEKGSIRFVK